MCGRLACALEPDDLSCACDYKDSNGKRRVTSWGDDKTSNELQFKPSPNMGPRDTIACIVAGHQLNHEDDRILCSMLWGMIPPWHKGEYKKHTVTSHNARIEGVRDSKLYSPSLKRGQRCVVVCEGFYEWQTTGEKQATKQPYYIYAPQEEGIKVDEPETFKNEWSEQDGWKGERLLKFAGLYSNYKTEEGKTVRSCTILTTEATDVLSWLHHRMPVILENEEQVQIWLDSKNTSFQEALSKLESAKLSKNSLKSHPVSTQVNNVRFKSDECKKEIKTGEVKKKGATGLMAAWLQKGSTKRKSSDNDNDKGSDKKFKSTN